MGKSGSTPLDTAAYYNQPGIVKFLIGQEKLDVYLLEQAWNFAQKRDNHEVMEILAAHMPDTGGEMVYHTDDMYLYADYPDTEENYYDDYDYYYTDEAGHVEKRRRR